MCRKRFDPCLMSFANMWRDSSWPWVIFWTNNTRTSIDEEVPNRFWKAASLAFATMLKSENKPVYVLLPANDTEPRDPLVWHTERPTIWNTVEWHTL